ncbi:histone deacetylase, partial [Thermodesulfobacteriota bacterium]
GYTVNVPLPGGQGDADYLYVLESVIAPVAEAFEPQLIGVSAGFDTYFDDPLGAMDVTPAGFAAMAGLLAGLAERLCSGRIFFCLEGGYHIEGQASAVAEVLKVLSGEGGAGAVDTSARSAETAAIVDRVVSLQGRYWSSL